MISFTQTELYQILKPTPTELDIPAFLRRAHASSRMFFLDEPFLMNLRAMICETKQTSKQLEGLLIASVCFNPVHCQMEASLHVFNKSIMNPVFQSIQQVIN
jgi:hypothetical protein